MFLWIPLAVVAGGIIGAWGPAEELHALKTRAAKTESAKTKTQGFDAFARVMNIPDVARKRRFRRERPGETKPPAEAKASAPAEIAPGKADRAPRSGGHARQLNPEDLRARIEEAAELWRARGDLVFADTVKKLALDADGEARLQEIVEQMNEAVRSSVQAVADALAEEEALTPELGVRLMGDLSATMAETYDRIGECAGAERRAAVSRLNLADFIDPTVAEPLVGVQHKLGGLSSGRLRQ
jgi:hypothetical protein